MANLALYREFRPSTFDEVIGQDHIVQTLKNQIITGNLSHAYLFCGTRGTGKTSCAKIFAKAVNCLNPKNGLQCGECENCKNILSNGNLDILEIDAASNNRVDEIRDLREKVNYLPSVGKYKVYIIDEVHMLTDSAFNALLKTLEEPPKHIIFILATTEPQKLPATILSRCMRFDFKLVSIEDLVGLLKNIFNNKKIKYEDKSLELIAKSGKGSVRDTLSVAEMCRAYANDNITYKSVEECLGITDEKTLYSISNAILTKNGGDIIEFVDELYKQGKNLSVLLSDLCEYFKNILTVKLVKNHNLQLPENIIQNYVQMAELSNEKYLLDCLKKLCDAENLIKFSLNTKVYLQTILLSMFYDDNLEIEMLKQKIKLLEDGNIELAQKKTKLVPIQQVSNVSFNENTTETQQTLEKADANISAKEIFGELIKHTRQNGEMMLYASMADVSGVDYVIDTFVINCKTQSCLDLILEHKKVVENFLSSKYNILKLEIKLFVDKEKQKIVELNELLDGKLKIK